MSTIVKPKKKSAAGGGSFAAGAQSPNSTLPALQASMSAVEARKRARDGLTPLEYLVSIYRDPNMPTETRIDAAKSALPYVHRRMPMEVISTASTTHTKRVIVEFSEKKT